MKLTEAEKLTLLVLADIHEHLDINGASVDASLIKEAILSGNTWALSPRYGGAAFSSEDQTEVSVNEVYDILQMWSMLEESSRELRPEDRKRVEDENHGSVKMPGFDGHEDQLGIARFIIEQLHGFESLAGRANIDCHFPTHRAYIRMVVAFKPILTRVAEEMHRPARLTADEILEVLRARRALE